MSYDEIVFKNLDFDNMPAIVCFKNNIKHAPLIVFSHGFKGNKECFREEMVKYARNDFFTVSIDNKGHGDRNDTPFFEYAMKDKKLNILKVRELINETAKEIPGLIDLLENDGRVDCRRTGMAGYSMGGFITYRAMMLENRIKAAAPFISSPAWNEFPRNVPVVDDIELRRQLKEYSEKNSPVNFPEKFYDRNILIQIGKNDNHFNIENVRLFVDKVNEHSADKIRLIEYDNVAHDVTIEMKETAFDWLKKVL